MKKLFKILILIYFLFTDFILFAQIGGGPGDEDDNGSTGLEGGDPPAAPINVRLWIFIIIGIAYAFLLFKRINKINKPRG
ncbi:hypothetical protein [Flavobacterium sp.]|jgi:hypothetical protein|uniref:hypothetical protein n=1 Tax=Flavobacterium sp. TaxID=239 RepID=UPI0037C0A273